MTIENNNPENGTVMPANGVPTTGAPLEPIIYAGDPDDVVQQQPVAEEAPVVEPVLAEAPAATPEEDSTELGFKPVEPRPDSTTVVQQFETFQPLDKKGWSDNLEFLPIPSETKERAADILSSMPNLTVSNTPRGVEWERFLDAAENVGTYDDAFVDTVEREGSQYRQAVESERGLLGASVPRFHEKEGAKLVGQQALLRIRALTGLGTIIQIPLWHSGFWITLKAPTDSDLLELNRRMAEEKVNLGRYTYGLAYSNTSVFYTAWVMDFVFANVYECSLKDRTNLEQKISALDIPILAWGLACTIWPSGFQYAKSVLDQAGGAERVIKEKLSIGRLHWTDTAALTPWQIAHMANRHAGTITDDLLVRYRAEFTRGQGRKIQLNDNIAVTLRVPNVEQQLNSGQAWINNIVAMVDRAFGLPPEAEQRNRYIDEQGRATNLRQFGQWIESIHPGSNVIDDADSINEAIDVMSSSPEMRDAFFKGVRRFMEDSTISLIALPVTEAVEAKPLPRFPHLIPLDVLSTFFILLVQKVRLIQAR
jgi:hypothetical protein